MLLGAFVCRLSKHFSAVRSAIREIKLDVTWSYVKRQTSKMTPEFVFSSANPSLNHIKKRNRKMSPTIRHKCKYFTLLFKELKTDGQSFIFAVCRKTT